MVARQLRKNEVFVLDALSSAAGPLSAYTLLDRLRGHGLRAPLQVYRALEKLIEQGLVHKLESVNAFVACTHPHDCGQGSVAFTICDACGQVEEFADAEISRRLGKHAEQKMFRVARLTIELRGTCGACLAA